PFVLLKHWGELFLKTSISVSLLLRLLGFFRLIVSITELTPREQNLNLNKSLKKPKSSLSSRPLAPRQASRGRVTATRDLQAHGARAHHQRLPPASPSRALSETPIANSSSTAGGSSMPSGSVCSNIQAGTMNLLPVRSD